MKLLALHNRETLPLGRARLLRPDARGLYGEIHVSATTAGGEALALVPDRALDAFSVGFRPMPNGDRWSQDRTRVERVEVALAEVSLVPWGAYAGAVVEGSAINRICRPRSPVGASLCASPNRTIDEHPR